MSNITSLRAKQLGLQSEILGIKAQQTSGLNREILLAKSQIAFLKQKAIKSKPEPTTQETAA